MTDWDQILALCDHLVELSPTRVVALNRAIALAEVQGPAVALALADELDLGGYYLLHATGADLLRRLERNHEAAEAYARAAELAQIPTMPTGFREISASASSHQRNGRDLGGLAGLSRTG